MTKKKGKGSKSTTTTTSKNKVVATNNDTTSANESANSAQKKELTSAMNDSSANDTESVVVEPSTSTQQTQNSQIVEQEHSTSTTTTNDASSQQQQPLTNDNKKEEEQEQQQQQQQPQQEGVEEEVKSTKKAEEEEEEQEQQNQEEAEAAKDNRVTIIQNDDNVKKDETSNEHDTKSSVNDQVEATNNTITTTTTTTVSSELESSKSSNDASATDDKYQNKSEEESIVNDTNTANAPDASNQKDNENNNDNNSNNPSPHVITDMIQSFMTQMSSQMEENLVSRVNSLSSQLDSVQNKYKLLKEKQKQQEASVSNGDATTTNDNHNQSVASSSSTTTATATVDVEELKQNYEKQLTQKTDELESLKKKMADWKEKVKIITKKDAQKIESYKKQISQKEELIKSLQDQIAATTTTQVETHSSVSSEDGIAAKTESADFEHQKKEFAERIASLERDLADKNDLITNLNTMIESLKENERLRLQEEQNEKQKTAIEEAKQDKKESDPSKISVLYSVHLDDVAEQSVEWHYVRDENITDETQQYYWTLTIPSHNNEESEEKNGEESSPFSLSLKQYRELQDKSAELTSNLNQHIAQVDSLNEELKRYKQRAQKALKKKMDEVSTLKIENEQRIKTLSGERDVLADSLKEQQQINSELKEQLTQFIALQEELIRSNETCDKLTAENEKLSTQVSQLTSQVSELKTTNAHQLESERTAHESKVLELSDNMKQVETQYRKELQMSRERTRRLLDEKEREIAKLQLKMQDIIKKQQMKEAEQQVVVLQQPQETVVEQLESPAKEEQLPQQESPKDSHNSTPTATSPREEKPDIISSVLSDITNGHMSASSTDIPTTTSANTPATNNSPTQDVTPSTPSQSSSGSGPASDFEKMLALAQIQATRDVELSEYKRTIHALQHQLEERKQREEQLKKMEKQMKDQIDHFERLYESGTGPNLEYLKNVLCKFLETANDDKNDQMRRKLFNVIATILDLSQNEQEKIMQQWKSKEGKDNASATPLGRWSIFGGK